MSLKDARLFVANFVKGEYSPEEYAAFLTWLRDASIEELGIIAEEHEALFEQWSLPDVAPSPEWALQLEQRLDQADEQAQAPVRKMNPGRYIRNPWVAAASVVLLLLSGGYLLYNNHSGDKNVVTTGNQSGALYNTYTVPRGGMQREFTLADGSKIWLNAASTLKVPVSFNGGERTVELSGEGYFEVTGNVTKPFHVKIRNAEIEVLGTHFNVKAYDEESTSKTTLVDGAVKVVRGSQTLQLKPGDQAEINYPPSGSDPSMRLIRGINIDAVLSWKSGGLDFKDDNLSTVMQAIARCYDVEIRYQSGVPNKRFTGNFSRKSNISQILNQLEDQGIHCKQNGKIITVMH
ncbi:MAG TPA: FecR domain-containing protein [Puia sp.]|jgi:ferric-dicitrate binding protein FerR (iron transport regulator)|nr:FecR domain-containing protein [Puia sp.]